MTCSDTNMLLQKNSRYFGYYELPIFSFLLFEFFVMIPDKVVDSIAMASYLITYKFGFASKALVGSIFSLFTDIITSNAIYNMAVIAFMILIAFISSLLGTVIRRSRSEVRPSVILFVILFLSSPLSVTYLLGMYLGRFDTYWIIITLVSLLFLKKPFLRWTIPLLCGIAISVHQGYMFSYMPSLAIPLLYEIYKNKYSKINIAVFLLSCFSAILLFIIFQVSPSKVPFDNALYFSDYLSNFADFKVSVVMLYNVYFANFKESFYGYVQPLLLSYVVPACITILTYSLPLILIFGVLWKNCFCNTGNRFLKFIFILCAFSPLIFIPIIFLLNDLDRYISAIINTQFILIFYFIYSNESSVIDSVIKIGNFFDKHFLLLIVTIIFLCSIKFSEAVTNIFSFIQDKDAVSKALEEYMNSKIFGY